MRIVAATNRNLESLVEARTFRSDLYYRLNVGRIKLPNLEEQKEAIAPLAQMFLTRFSEERQRKFRFVTTEVIDLLTSYHWPGNIRQLANVIRQATILYDDISLRPSHLESLALSKSDDKAHLPILELGGFRLPEVPLPLKKLEQEIMELALEKFDGNKTRAAEYLGISRNT